MVKCQTSWCKTTKVDPKTKLCNCCTNWVANQAAQAGAPNLASLSSFPSVALAGVQVDTDAIDAVCSGFKSGDKIQEDDFKRAMFGMMANVFSTVNSQGANLEAVKCDVKDNSDRLKALEDKVGDKDECAVPLSITLQNFPMYGVGDESAVKSVIKAINAEGVDAEQAVVKVIRKGYKPANVTHSERLGTVLVELQSSEVKAKIMRAKKVLATNAQLKDVRVSQMKTQTQISQDFFNRQLLKMVPGGEECYISGTGAILPKSRPPGPPAHQGPRPQGQGHLPGQYQVRRPPGLHHQFQHHPEGRHVQLPRQPNYAAALLLSSDPEVDLSQPPPSAPTLREVDF